MLSFLDGLRDVSLLSVALRMLLAVVCGGIIGLEREFKRRPAGFRTHILICLGAAVTTLTSQYLLLGMDYYTDIARMGAQVVAGIGFIGAGTIIVTRRRRVKGLTTAAGMWASAIVGLAIGAGFYEGALIAVVLVMLVELVFARLEYYIMRNAPEVNLYIEYLGQECLDTVLAYMNSRSAKVTDLEITRSSEAGHNASCAVFSLQLTKRCPVDTLVSGLSSVAGVVSVEEL